MLHNPNSIPYNQDISYISKDNSDKNSEESVFSPAHEKALWRAVITQAVMDAGSHSRKPDALHEKTKAIRWLLGNSRDFIIVCLNAGLEPAYVRKKALELLKNGYRWRHGMAKRKMLAPQQGAARPFATSLQTPSRSRNGTVHTASR